MSTKHTPGPWTVAETGEVISLAQPSPAGNHYAVVCWHGSEFHRINPANARLIAAAPDLLEACKAMASCSGEGSQSFATARKMARAANAKAEGK